jgi:Predicted membrane protein (DUF2231)
MRIFGHPIHPMLVHFPIVFWTVAVGAYVASAAGLTESIDAIAKFANGAGLVMAMLAMIAGLLELRTIDSRSEAMRWRGGTCSSWQRSGVVNFTRIDRFDGAAGCRCLRGAGFPADGCRWLAWGRLVYEFGIAVKYRV